MSLAIAPIIGATAVSANCLYARVSDSGILNVSGKPISRAHSRGVRRLGFVFFKHEGRRPTPIRQYLLQSESNPAELHPIHSTSPSGTTRVLRNARTRHRLPMPAARRQLQWLRAVAAGGG